jgi:hypothetical protein
MMASFYYIFKFEACFLFSHTTNTLFIVNILTVFKLTYKFIKIQDTFSALIKNIVMSNDNCGTLKRKVL